MKKKKLNETQKEWNKKMKNNYKKDKLILKEGKPPQQPKQQLIMKGKIHKCQV